MPAPPISSPRTTRAYRACLLKQKAAAATINRQLAALRAYVAWAVENIRLYWPDTGGEFTIGPTADVVLPIPADSKIVSVTVTAPGFQDWSQELAPTRSSNLVVRLIRK